MRKQQRRIKPLERHRAKVKLPTFKGNGTKPGVDLDDSAALLDLMESDEDSDRRASAGGELPFQVYASACGFRPGINVMKLNALADELEIDDATTETPSE
jgi:hypothetical protein